MWQDLESIWYYDTSLVEEIFCIREVCSLDCDEFEVPCVLQKYWMCVL